MTKGYLNRNIVFIGEFKPAIFDRLYFTKGNFLSENDFLEGSIFLPDLTIIDTKNFVIEINQNRFSINFKEVNFKIEASLLIKLLRDSKIKAFGFNFKRALFIENISDSKKYFFFENNVLNNFFNSKETAYGYYISRPFEGSRLKLDIKPVKLQKVDENIVLNALDFNFNFHFEATNYEEELEKYAIYENLTLQVLNDYE